MQGKGGFCSDLSFNGIFQSFACLEHRRSGRRHLHRLTGAWIPGSTCAPADRVKGSKSCQLEPFAGNQGFRNDLTQGTQ